MGFFISREYKGLYSRQATTNAPRTVDDDDIQPVVGDSAAGHVQPAEKSGQTLASRGGGV